MITGSSEPTKEKSISYVCVILNSIISLNITKKLSQFLLLTVNISSWGLFPALDSIVALQGSPQGLKSSL